MGRLRIGTNNIDAIHASAGLLAGKKPVAEIGDSSHGSLRLGLTAVSSIHASAGLLAGKKPTVEVGDSANGGLRANIETVRVVHASAGLLAGKKPTLEIGIPMSESGSTPPVALELIRTGLSHWLIDVLGGSYMENGIRGNLDNAVFAVNSSGKVIIPASAKGNVLVEIRGVWLTTETFSWDGYKADPENDAAVNYYASSQLIADYTEITLSPSLPQSTQVQVYYTYQTTQQLGRMTYYGSYPFMYASYGGPFPEEKRDKIQIGWFSSAADAEYWYIVACHEAYLASGEAVYNDMATKIVEKCREYETISGNYLNTFDSALHEKPDGVWAKSDYGNLNGVIAYDPINTNNKVFKIYGYIGTWGGWGNWEEWNFTGDPYFKFRFRGQNLANSTNTTGIYRLKLKKTDGTEWTYSFADTSTGWKSYNLPLSNFKGITNIVYGDLSSYWWSKYGKAAKAGSEIRTNQMSWSGDFWIDSGQYHYICRKLEFDFDNLPYPSEGYDGAGFITGVPAACTSFSDNINFYVYADTAMNLRLKLNDTASASYEYTKYIETGSTRVTVDLTAFSPDATGKTIDQVYFQIDPEGIYPNEVRWPDKNIGSTGGSWNGVNDTISIINNNPNRSLIAGSKVYNKVITVTTHIESYAGFIFNIPSGVDSSRYDKVSWVMRSTMTQNIKVTVRDNNSLEHVYWANITADQTVRFNIAYGAFDGGVINHPIKDVRFEFYDNGDSITDFGEVRFGDEISVSFPAKIFVTDVKFGLSPNLYGTTEIKSYAFYWPAANSGNYYTTTYWDDVGIDYSPPDDYYGLTYSGYEWGDGGVKGSWRGAMYVGYLVPVAHYWKGYTAQAALAAQCIRDSQVEFASRMGRTVYTLFMPFHTRATSGGASYSDTNESNIFSFGRPEEVSQWGGYQCRIAAHLAHYFYLTGNSNAQNVLYDLVTYWNSVIIEDPIGSGKWRIPTNPKREGPKIKNTRSIGSNYIVLKGCPANDSAWVNDKDILYIEGDVTKYTITTTAATDSVGDVTIYISPALVVQANIDKKVMIVETETTAAHEKALMVQTFIYHYWKSGISISQTWYRRLLDDLINNRQYANGSFADSSNSGTYGFHQAEVGKALGMLINGRLGATPTYPLSATGADITAFQNLYNYMVNNIGSAKPCAMGLDWLPTHKYEDTPQLLGEGAGSTITNTAGTSEGISLCMHFALDYARYSGDYTWLNKIKRHLYEVTIGTPPGDW